MLELEKVQAEVQLEKTTIKDVTLIIKDLILEANNKIEGNISLFYIAY